MSIRDMRLTYAAGSLLEPDMSPDPWVQFAQWFEAAKSAEAPEWFEANAMTLSTADTLGRVSSRIVLLKEFLPHGSGLGTLTFYTNYHSTKGLQIESNPQVSLCFHWGHLQRQLRIEGTAVKSDRAKSEDYFSSRPLESQIGACASAQSTIVASREELEQQMERWQELAQTSKLTCPDNWGGYDVTPRSFEFWQGRPGRLHDRLQYTWKESGWRLRRLSP
jgi:pyridoxamine 5'-phosphate oxidase